ncbi:reverse transcriptase domain-containing protein [Tanacetum coccineum]
MSVRLADRSFQYPVGIAENILVEVGKFTFIVDFVILEMEEDSKVPIILGRPFLHTADAVIRVKQKQLNLRVGTERMIFHIDSVMKHSYSNDDICFRIDVIDEILEEDFDALLDKGSEILYSIKGIILEEKLFAEFDDFMAMTANENSESESDIEEPPLKKSPLTPITRSKHLLKNLLRILNSNLFLITWNMYSWKNPLFFLYFQIPIDPMDQEKTTFTCPFGTYAYRRMPFGLCNAPATFQRCMLAIFHDMIEESVEVFMDNFSVFGSTFDHCLNNLDKMLQRCKDAHLVLNWEKCHFMVKEGIVLGHKVSEVGLEVDKEKIDIISKLPSPTNIKVGVILGQKEGRNFYPIYFASKTLNAAQQNYTITEKELMVVVFAFDKFRSYLVLSKTIVHTDHSALRHLFKKQDVKPRLIRWILLLQEFDIEIKDRKVEDNFLGETLMEINTEDEPWFADFANYLASDIIPKGMTY